MKQKQSQGRFTLSYRFETEVEPIIIRKVKVESSTREHFHVLPYEIVNFNVESPWYQGSAKVRTYHLEELLGTKLRALYQRKKGRDLYDFWFAFKRIKNINVHNIVKIFNYYMAKGNTPVIRSVFRSNLENKQKDDVFNHDIFPLLRFNEGQVYSLDETYALLFDGVVHY